MKLADGEWQEGQPIYFGMIHNGEIKVYSKVPILTPSFFLIEDIIEQDFECSFCTEEGALAYLTPIYNDLVDTEIAELATRIEELRGKKL